MKGYHLKTEGSVLQVESVNTGGEVRQPKDIHLAGNQTEVIMRERRLGQSGELSFSGLQPSRGERKEFLIDVNFPSFLHSCCTVATKWTVTRSLLKELLKAY